MKKKINFLASLFTKKVFLTIDVGCDHGYLSIELLKKDKSEYVINIDNKIKPLQNAIKNTSKYTFCNRIINFLNDGLHGMKNDLHPDVIVIAGIGGLQIIKILKKSTIINFDKLILQPEGNFFTLRKWLIQNNFKIIDENVIKNNDISYLFIECKKSQLNQNYYNYFDYLLGPVLKNKANNNATIKEFYSKEIDLLNKIPKKYLNSEKVQKLNCLKNFMLKI